MSEKPVPPVIILCGGRGIRPRNYPDYIPKGMVRIGNRPMLWHIMKVYAGYGFTNFILALGDYGNNIRDYFCDYSRYTEDFQITLGKPEIKLLTPSQEATWTITFVETGSSAATGARIKRCERFVHTDEFMLTYSDVISNVDLLKLWDHHRHNGKLATITGVRPPFRYGEFVFENDEVVDFNEMSILTSMKGWINGGFMILNKEVFNYLSPFNECKFEKEPFRKLIADRQLTVFQHQGYWQYLDTDREIDELNQLCEQNQQPWFIDPDL